MEDSSITLPFSEIKQNSLLGHILVNESFFKTVNKRIKPNWFLAERNSRIFEEFVNYCDKFGTFPTVSEFKSSKFFTLQEPKERMVLFSYIDRAVAETQNVPLSSLRSELTEWLHSIILFKSMFDGQDAYNRKDIKRCHDVLMAAVKEVTTTNFDKGNVFSFDDYKEYLKEAENSRGSALTTGLGILDQALLKDATRGGLLLGDTTLVMSPVNCGKTSCLITIACHNVRAGKDVLVMTHEGAPSDIRLKILANMLDCPIPKIFELYKTKEGNAIIDTCVKMLNKHLKYIPYNKAGMTVEEVVPIIRANHEEKIATNNGKGFDLLVSDYPAILTTELAKKGTLQRRNIDEVIYGNYVQLALEYNFHSLLAIQTNREGSRVNKQQKGENRLLTIEDVMESWGPIAMASNVITLNRSPAAIKKEILTFNVAKCRSNETGVAIVAKSNFAHCVTHSEKLGGVAYRGSRTNEDQVEEILNIYKNQQIPESEAALLKLK